VQLLLLLPLFHGNAQREQLANALAVVLQRREAHTGCGCLHPAWPPDHQQMEVPLGVIVVAYNLLDLPASTLPHRWGVHLERWQADCDVGVRLPCPRRALVELHLAGRGGWLPPH
jgi:hypothetical protein